MALLTFVMLASCATPSIRYSSNPIGKLAVLGIQISESVDAANRMLEDPFGKNFLKNIDWPLVIDPSYKQLKEAAAVTLSFNNEQAGGITYTSALLACEATVAGLSWTGRGRTRSSARPTGSSRTSC